LKNAAKPVFSTIYLKRSAPIQPKTSKNFLKSSEIFRTEKNNTGSRPFFRLAEHQGAPSRLDIRLGSRAAALLMEHAIQE